MTKRATFTEADVTRALKGATAAGQIVREVFCSKDGVRLVLHDGQAPKGGKDAASAFDEFQAGE